jgi:hypothetical protein
MMSGSVGWALITDGFPLSVVGFGPIVRSTSGQLRKALAPTEEPENPDILQRTA